MVRIFIRALVEDPAFVEQSIDLAYAADAQESVMVRELERTKEAKTRLEGELADYVEDLRQHEPGSRSRKAIATRMKLVEEQIDAMEAQALMYTGRLAAIADRDRLKREHKDAARVICDLVAGQQELSDEHYRRALEGLGLKFYYHQGKFQEIVMEPGVWLTMGDKGLRISSTARRWSCESWTKAPSRST
jgi:hypothetical protein